MKKGTFIIFHIFFQIVLHERLHGMSFPKPISISCAVIDMRLCKKHVTYRFLIFGAPSVITPTRPGVPHVPDLHVHFNCIHLVHSINFTLPSVPEMQLVYQVGWPQKPHPEAREVIGFQEELFPLETGFQPVERK